MTNFLRDEQLQRDIAADGLWDNGQRFVRQVFHRFWRLAPLQFVVVLAGVVAVEYQRQVSVIEIVDPQDLMCHRNWLRNVLFIQNLFPIMELCGSWTWSLACDMQLHILALLLLFAHTRHPRAVRLLTCLLAGVSVLFPMVMMHLFQVGSTFEDFFLTGEWSYVCPVIRLLGYITGGAYAYTRVKGMASPFDLIVPDGWIRPILSGVLLWAIHLVTSDSLPAASIISALMSILRALVASYASHLMVCDSKEDTSDSYAPTRWLLAVLQSEQVQRMSRFTYAIYLLNPVVISWFYHSFSAGFNADTSMLVGLNFFKLILS